MTVESVTHISDLDQTYPVGSDSKDEGDNHIRNIKKALLTDLAGITGVVTATHTEINYLHGVTLGTAVASKALAVDASKDLTLGTGDLTCTDMTATGAVSAGTGFDLGGSSSMTAIETSLAGSTTKLVNAAAILPGYSWMLAAESVGTIALKTADLSSAGTVERIEIALNGVSISTTGMVQIRLGTGLSLTATGYSGTAADVGGDTAISTGFDLAQSNMVAAATISGIVHLTHLGSNAWVASGVLVSTYAQFVSGYVTLAGALDIVGLVATAGVFDAGSWKVTYQRSA